MSEPRRRQARRPLPPPPRRAGRTAATLLVALAGLLVLVASPAAVAVGWYAHQQARAAEEASRSPVGSEVPEGAATFVVAEVRCGADEDTVHGQRCQVELSVRNDGDEELTVPGIAQMLGGPDGVRHLPRSDDDEPFGTLEPGERATAVLDYDVPTHARVTHVVVHEDVYSRGERINLPGPPRPLFPPAD